MYITACPISGRIMHETDFIQFTPSTYCLFFTTTPFKAHAPIMYKLSLDIFKLIIKLFIIKTISWLFSQYIHSAHTQLHVITYTLCLASPYSMST